MQVKPEQLGAALAKNLPPLIWVSGDETLLVQEACDEVREFARNNHFGEREILDAGPAFNWNALLQSASNLSLFAEKKLMDLRLASPKLDNEAKEALREYANNPGEDNLLLITSARVEKAATSTKWFKAIESAGLFIQVWPINIQQLPQWIQRRMQHHGLSADPDALALLAERVEGNLLAAAQEVEKLAVLYEGQRLNPDMVMRAVADSSRFSIYTLIDAALAGNAARALNILYHLRAEGGEALHILNQLCKELRALTRMRAKVEQGQNLNGVMQTERVWKNRTQIVGTALKNHNVRKLEEMLKNARVVDQSVKGVLKNNAWDELADLLLRLANVSLGLST